MDPLQSTRGRILASIKRQGTGHPDLLASELGLASTSVRQHLTALQHDGYVATERVREGAGRPRHLYRITPAGDALFPKRYAALAAGLLHASADAANGRGGVVASFVEEEVAARKSRVNGLDTRSRMDEVAAIMREDGGMANVIETDDAVGICEPNCIYAAVAVTEPAVCEAHVATIQRLLAIPATFTRTTDPFRGGCTWMAPRPQERPGEPR